MTIIRDYRESDTAEVGRLIARTFSTFNLGFAPADQRAALLGPFSCASSDDPERCRAISEAIAAPVVFVAEIEGAVVGVLRGGRLDRPGRAVLQSLFVDGPYHRRGLGSRLVERFEQTCRARGIGAIKVSSTLSAVAFYKALGYRRSTGIRSMRSFDGGSMPYQPMIKQLAS